MKRVLFSTDFSEACQNAFDYLKAMIAQKDIKVDFIHVFDIPIAPSIPPKASQGMKISKVEASEAKMNSLRSSLLPSQQGEIRSIYATVASSEIASLADKLESDLIVMGLRKKYGMLERMMGTTTAQVIEKSTAPVLAIPSKATYQTIETVLFPTSYEKVFNLSDYEVNTLVWLHDFLHLIISPKIHILHVDDNMNEADSTKSHFPISEIDFSITHAKHIDDGIIAFLIKTKVDLLAFYKPHRNFWSRLYSHSVSQEVLYKSGLPVLIFTDPV